MGGPVKSSSMGAWGMRFHHHIGAAGYEILNCIDVEERDVAREHPRRFDARIRARFGELQPDFAATLEVPKDPRDPWLDLVLWRRWVELFRVFDHYAARQSPIFSEMSSINKVSLDVLGTVFGHLVRIQSGQGGFAT